MNGSDTDAPQLEVDQLNLWRGESWLVRNLCLAADAGDLLHVVGPNGSGKTTLLRALCGLTRPESGTITWRGRPLERDLLAYHSELAWLGHRDGLKPELTPFENLQTYQRLGRAASDNEIAHALQRAGVANTAKLPTRVLSAGQKRRVALARVLCSQARLWILDEPFSNLDRAGQRWGIALLEEHVHSGGIAIVTTHQRFDAGQVVLIELEAQ